jgi:hypothetical protein
MLAFPMHAKLIQHIDRHCHQLSLHPPLYA